MSYVLSLEMISYALLALPGSFFSRTLHNWVTCFDNFPSGLQSSE